MFIEICEWLKKIAPVIVVSIVLVACGSDDDNDSDSATNNASESVSSNQSNDNAPSSASPEPVQEPEPALPASSPEPTPTSTPVTTPAPAPTTAPAPEPTPAPEPEVEPGPETSEVDEPDTNTQARSSVRQFTFNHSLWAHTSTEHTNTVTGYWIGEFANASGTTYAWNGQFGQLDYHALPAQPQLGSSNSADVFPSSSTRFRDVEVDNVVIMAPNFVQSTSTVQPQFIEAAQRVINYLLDPSQANKADEPIYIYEHWPEASSDNLNASEFQDYHALTKGRYHQWHLDYQNRLRALYPQADVRMIPVGPIIADIMQNNTLSVSQLAFTDLYDDNAPHGRPNTYFLAGLITYQVMYGQRVNSSYVPPTDSLGGVNTRISSEFDAINEFVWQRLNFYNSQGVRIWP